jgi:hypothetical protein
MGWDTIEYRVVDDVPPAGLVLVQAISEEFVNGGCVLRRFAPVDPAQFEDAARHDLQGLGHLLGAFLARPEIQSALEKIGVADAEQLPPEFRTMGAFEFEGALTHTLLAGGAYTRGLGDEDLARQIARDFVDALLPGRKLSATVFSIAGPWTPWFYDVAWDSSYFVFDRTAHAWWTLLMTDTD